MKKKSPLRGFVVIALLIAAAVLLVRHFHIKNFNIIQEGVLYTSGQPRGMDYARLLYKYHIGTIINLRSPAEHREKNWHNEEITWVRSNGVKYFEMPLDRDINVPGHFPDANMQERFLDIMNEKENVPILVHDGSGESRSAMLVAVWIVRGRQSQPVPGGVEQILETAEKIKNEPLVDAETRFIQGLFR